MKKFESFFTRTHIAFILTAAITIAHFQAIAQQNPVSQHEKIALGVEQFITRQLESNQTDEFADNLLIDVTPVDSRIKIPDCSLPFEYDVDSATLTQSYLTVRVSCNENNWYLFTTAKVTRTRTIVVTASMISPNTVISAGNVTLAEVDIKQLRHTPYTSVDAVVGARLKYRVREGQPVQSNMLCFVCKGDRITISARAAGMAVKTSGIAQQDGVIGDTIRVENSNSRKTVVAEVASTQEVVVNL
jgi:flagella basal body P-ring formation protein FlgA